MDNKFFDHIVKSKLENLTSDATPRWDLFQEKKSVHDSMRADTAFDNNIRKTMSEYSQPYNPNHWNLLKARLERIYGLRKALYSTKVYELLAVLLLFYTVGSNYDYIFSDTIKANVTVSQPIALANEQVINSELEDIVNASLEISDDKNSIKATNPKITNSSAERSNIENTASTSIISTATKNTITNEAYASASGVTSIGSDNNIQNTSAIINEALLANNSTEMNSSLQGMAESAPTSYTEYSDLLHLESIAVIKSTLEIDELEHLIIPDDFGIKPINKVIQDGKWLQVAASFDNNLITTPYNEIYNLGGPQTGEMFGYSLSGLFSIQKGKMEYESGLTYSVYNRPIGFRRPWENNRGDVFMYSLTNINYDILSVPLRVKYHFANTSDWSLYLTGGLSSGFIVNTGYDERNDRLDINVPTPQGPVEVKPELTESPFRTESNFHSGLFEQGAFKDNFILRAQIGAGMQRNITPTLSAFISGDYYNSIINTTYGPTDDKINKFSITFGIKERF